MIPLLALAFWEYQSLVGALPRYLPPPSAIGRELIAMLASGELFVHIGASLFRALSGFAIRNHKRGNGFSGNAALVIERCESGLYLSPLAGRGRIAKQSG